MSQIRDRWVSPRLRVETVGAGAPLLVLLHGSGANGDVWAGLIPYIARGWPGRCLVPDLRGHGRSGHALPYAYGTYAADIATVVAPEADAFLVGHSLGGAVALTLATGWFGLRVRGVVAFGVKVDWSADELGRRRRLASAPVRWFDRREDAIERYLKISGQFGLVGKDSPAALSGIVEEAGRYRLAADPAINGGDDLPDITAIYRAASAPVTIAVGSRDPMLSAAEAQGLAADAVILDGLGHNVHIERPEAIWELIARASGIDSRAARLITTNKNPGRSFE
ncbi:MAG: alpha/beta fold hydrolase [Stellaceae bacterium]